MRLISIISLLISELFCYSMSLEGDVEVRGDQTPQGRICKTLLSFIYHHVFD